MSISRASISWRSSALAMAITAAPSRVGARRIKAGGMPASVRQSAATVGLLFFCLIVGRFLQPARSLGCLRKTLA